MSRLALITVPYHLGREAAGPASGPDAYLAAGLEEQLRAAGHEVQLGRVQRPTPFSDELSAILAIDAALADRVRAARTDARLPVVVGGDCNIALGVTAALPAASTALVWFDAHGDFNTPQTSPSGYLDGMPLAMLTGRCHTQAVADALGGTRLPDVNVVHVGGRDLDPGESRALADSRVAVISPAELVQAGPADALGPALDALRQSPRPRAPGDAHGQAAYVHLDLDVLDPSWAPAVDYPAPGGLSPDELDDCVGLIAQRFPIVALSLSALDPQQADPDHTTVAVGLRALLRAVHHATAATPS